jgi:single-stranded-DNA-specific exonuclease
MDTERIGFVIGPRLNAAGRIDDARLAYRLLMTDDVWEARELAQKLEAQNRRRQALMSAITEQARELARQMRDDIEVIVLHSPNWASDVGNPLGVIGLVAGKLADEFGRPALVLAPSPNEGESRGSARSTPDFDIHEALTQVKDLLVQFGGHSAAAGLTIKNERIQELNDRLCALAAARLKAERSDGAPVTMVDKELTLADVSDKTMHDINELAPFGSGNPCPLFMARGLSVVDAQPVGDSAHFKLWLADRTNLSRPPIEAIAFRMAHLARTITRGSKVDVLFHIERRHWKGEVSLQLRVRDVHLAE